MLKTSYLAQVGAEKTTEKNASVGKLRFFALGKELKDELFIYSYDIEDNIAVQAMLRQE